MSRAPGDELPGADAGLAQTWREASREEPPAALDDAIRAAARKAVHARPRPAAGSPFGSRWRVPLSVAAVLVVSATITLLVAERERDASRASHDRTVPPAAGAPAARSVEPAPEPAQTPARAFVERGAPAPVAGNTPREPEAAPIVQEEPKALSPAPPPPLVSAQKPQMRAQPAEQSVRQMPSQEAAPVETESRQGQRAEAQQAGAPTVAPAAAPPMPRADDSLRDEAAKLTKREAEPVPRAKERAAATAPAAPATLDLGAQDAPAPKAAPRAFSAAPQTNASAEGAVAAGTESLEPKAWLDRILELRRHGKREEAAKSLKAFRERYPAYPLPDELKSTP